MSETGQGSRAGSQFGRYQLRRLLGPGGMGEVYEAHDTVKDRVVAVKLMSAQVSSDPVFRERMQREAHTAGRLQEPHVVPIHDYGEIDGQLFIDMRFIEGTDAGALLERYGPLPPPRAVAIVRQVAAALDAAHAAGVMHRDIKPENILITRRGGVSIRRPGRRVRAGVGDQMEDLRRANRDRNDELRSNTYVYLRGSHR